MLYGKRHKIGKSEPRPEGRDHNRNLSVAALISALLTILTVLAEKC